MILKGKAASGSLSGNLSIKVVSLDERYVEVEVYLKENGHLLLPLVVLFWLLKILSL